MDKISVQNFLCDFTKKIVMLLSVFLVILPVSAAEQNLLSSGAFVNHNIAFILGMTLPVLLILSLLKPVVNIKIRYPIILSAVLLIQLFSLSYLAQWQAVVLLLSASVFIAALSFVSLIDKLSGKLQQALLVINILAIASFFVVVLFVQQIDAYLSWIAYVAIQLVVAVIAVNTLRKQADFHLKRELVLWGLTAVYGVVLYLWLVAKIEVFWLTLTGVVTYLLFVGNHCWSVAQAGVIQYTKTTEQELELQQETIENNAAIDPITNLPNYQHSLNYLKQYHAQGHNQIVAIAFKPINFAQVNKVLGHHNSDILLLQLAYSLQKSLADNELLINFGSQQSPTRVARLQGLDFIVALDMSKASHSLKIEVEQVCNQLKKAIPNAMSFKSFSLNFELTFGVADMQDQDDSIGQLLAYAGDALLEAEHDQQPLKYFERESTLYTEQRLRKMELLKQDIANNSLTWFVQPQISLQERHLIGFEIYSTWRNSHGNQLTANEFIEIAEYSGEIYLMTRQIIEQACQLLAELHQKDFISTVSINLSSTKILEPDLVEYIVQQAKTYSTPLESLIVELDESILIQAAKPAHATIDQLKSIGVKVAIANFSGSYESLRYLRRMVVDQVKIDCSSLDEKTSEGLADKTIVNALINLIRKMQLPIIATGVNSKEIESSYVALGGDFAQGKIIEKGVAISDAEKWAMQWLSANLNLR